MVNVLVVDDSSFMRRSLTALLESDPDIKVIATANNGQEALKKVHELDPDVITLDVEMPIMDGLTALRHIMAEKPCPIIMVSSLTSDGAETTLKAMDLGALDYLAKPSSSTMPDLAKLKFDVCAKIKALARRKAFLRLVHSHNAKNQKSTKPERPAAPSYAAPSPSPRPSLNTSPRVKGNYEALFIGVSTGGPPAVQKILSCLPANFPAPILIAQHMPAAFTGPFAARLNTQCQIEVVEAEGVFRLKPGTAYIAPGGKHMRVEIRGGLLTGIVNEEPKTALYKPSANELMESAGLAFGRKAFCIILTGMGSDGAEGIKVVKDKGGKVIAQSEKTCVVYGMPKAIVDANLADEVVDLDNIANVILSNFNC